MSVDYQKYSSVHDFPMPDLEMAEVGVPEPIAKRIEEEIELRIQPVPAMRGLDDMIKKILAALITEDSTDILVDAVKKSAPWGTGWLVGRLLDRLLPEKLLWLAYRIVDRVTGA